MSIREIANRNHGLAQLQHFLAHGVKDYAWQRNFDCGPGAHNNVSQLSAYLRHRLISEHEVIAAVLEQFSLEHCEKFIQEVLWRSYWKGWLELRPAIWREYTRDLARLQERQEEIAGLKAAQAGATDIDCFDFWVRELRETGYLHNHARMWFASIWYFSLGLPWQLGAHFFMQHLLDGDPASNTLSWRWVVGLQTKNKHYLASTENIQKFTHGRFRAALPAPHAARDTFREHPAPALPEELQSQPPPESTLLMTTDDLSFDLHLATTPRRVLIFEHRAQECESKSSQCPHQSLQSHHSQFIHGALEDCVGRLKEQNTCEVQLVSPSSLNDELESDLTSGRQLCCVQPFCGESTDALRSVLACGGFTDRVSYLRRPWDSTVFPHATHGFFRFRESIGGFVASLGECKTRESIW